MNHRIHNIYKAIQGRELTHTQYLHIYKSIQWRELTHTRTFTNFQGRELTHTTLFTNLSRGDNPDILAICKANIYHII